ncbi:MAG TPA: hypothetical protein VF407_05045, partial [Polyangiaceae bacterium]
MSLDPRAHYEEASKARAHDAEALEQRSRGIGTLRLACVAIALGALGAGAWAHLPNKSVAWAAFAAAVIAFGVLVVVHGRIIRKKDRAAAARDFNDRGLARLDGTWSKLPYASDTKTAPNHPFAGDLDIFGP